MHRKQKKNTNPYNQNMNHQYNDPFRMDEDDFGFGIRDDFDDPFEGMMGGLVSQT